MAMQVVNGAVLMCTMSLGTPSTLGVLPLNRTRSGGQLAANIMDHKPFVNIKQFPTCLAPANPAVIAATSAALGTPTPSVCTPMTMSPWVPGSPTVMIGGAPALNSTSMCMCTYGGMVTVGFAGQATEMIP